MKISTKELLSTVAAFAAAPLLTALVLAIVDAARFHPGGEFASAFQAAEFDFFLWGLLLVASGIGYALPLAMPRALGRGVPWPKITGFIMGAACVIAADLGVIPWLHGVIHLPWPVVTGIPGLIAGVAVAILALATKPVRPRVETRG